MRKNLVINLRRNIGHGQVLEGLEIRWEKVHRILEALTKLGRWRLDNSIGPMHQWYDPKLFDVLSEAEMRKRYAPKVWQGEVLGSEDIGKVVDPKHVEHADARTAAELLGAGLHVNFVDGPGGIRGQGEGEEAPDEVGKEAFCTWMTLSEPPLGNALGRWWGTTAG